MVILEGWLYQYTILNINLPVNLKKLSVTSKLPLEQTVCFALILDTVMKHDLLITAYNRTFRAPSVIGQ